MSDTPETDEIADIYPIPTSTDILHFARQLERERNIMRNALQRISDCDWVITLPDRMDGVRKIARDALEAAK